jgi:glycine/serine hydroxymethyltransferase
VLTNKYAEGSRKRYYGGSVVDIAESGEGQGASAFRL